MFEESLITPNGDNLKMIDCYLFPRWLKLSMCTYTTVGEISWVNGMTLTAIGMGNITLPERILQKECIITYWIISTSKAKNISKNPTLLWFDKKIIRGSCPKNVNFLQLIHACKHRFQREGHPCEKHRLILPRYWRFSGDVYIRLLGRHSSAQWLEFV